MQDRPTAPAGTSRRARPALSVVIPALNEEANIAACVRSVRAQDPAAQVIVVDGGSADGTVAAARPLAEVVVGARGRAVQMNGGAARATGDVLLFLHADSVLHPHALRGLRGALRDPRVVGGTFTLRFDGDESLLRLYGYLTRLPLAILRYGDQGIFVRRTVFERIGGFRPLALMEDVEFLRRLRGAGRLALVQRPVTTSARRFRRGGLVRQQLLNIGLVAAYRLGASPDRLARWYAAVR